jgi:hypothetical protein
MRISSEQANVPVDICVGEFCPANKIVFETEEGKATLDAIVERCKNFAGCIVLQDAELAERGVK